MLFDFCEADLKPIALMPGSMASSSKGHQSAEGESHGLDAVVPERVNTCLKKAKDFGDFKQSRCFRFLHLFAGPKDVLAEALRAECEREGIKLVVDSFDKLLCDEHDLAAEQPFAKILENAKNDEYDGGHAGFPCNSFSRARYNTSGDGPPPVRSKMEIYGLSTNNKKQQAEADKGTSLAIRSALVTSEIILSQRRRSVPNVGTLENPPGSESQEEGPAWCLPELKAFEEKLSTVTALFNTCAFQDKVKYKWFKPGRFTGCLSDLALLSKRCNCPAGRKHQALVGKELTSRAAEYPEGLTKAYASLVVKSFKTTLQMEWWRFQLKMKKEEVSIAQKNWLASKQKRQLPPTSVGELASSKRLWSAEDLENEQKPSDGPSRKKRREGENEHFVGGMRNPAKAVSRLFKVMETGKDIRRLWTRFVREHPQAISTAKDYGCESCELNEEVLKAWRDQLEHFLKARDFKEVALRPQGRFRSPLNARLWEAWRRSSGDPETELVSWIRTGTPLGMSSEIPYCGIFPMSDGDQAEADLAPDIQLQLEVENYKSFKEEPDHARLEVQRYLEKGFCVELSEAELKEQFPTGTVSKLALILKEKEDGSIKRRVIIDLLRSGGNKRCRVNERIVLPRIVDVRDSLKYLRENRFGLILRAQREGWADQEECDEIELVSADMADAYCHLAVCEEELCHCISPSVAPGKFLVFTAMLFGFKGAPLVMGRFAAALARFIQSLVPQDELQSQIYMDDPLWMLQGKTWR